MVVLPVPSALGRTSVCSLSLIWMMSPCSGHGFSVGQANGRTGGEARVGGDERGGNNKGKIKETCRGSKRESMKEVIEEEARELLWSPEYVQTRG